MNALNAIPVVGWIVAAILCLVIAIPVSLLWNWLAPIYFYWLPQIYMNLPFWHVVGLLWLVSSLKGIVLPSMQVKVETKS